MYYNINAKFWGSSYCDVFYNIAAMYPDTTPDEQFKKNVQMFLQSLNYILPCSSCRTSYNVYSNDPSININDINNYNTKLIFCKMIYNLREKVNIKVEVNYKISFDYFWKKINLMVSIDNNRLDYYMNNIKEMPLIQDQCKSKIYNFIKSNNKYINNYKNNFTEVLCKKLEAFCLNPDFNIKNKIFLLWIKRNKECNHIISEIYSNMALKNYSYKESIKKNKALWVKLFYLGCNPVGYSIINEIL